MANFNKVILLGNIARDLEVRYTQGGLAIAKFGLAVNRKAKTKDGEMKESVCFVDITAFGKTAEVLEKHVGKGEPLFVEGRLNFSTWEDKNGGGNRSKLDVILENFQFVGGKGGGEGDGQRQKQAAGASQGDSVDYDDIPF